MLADPAIQSRLQLGRNKQISTYLSIYLTLLELSLTDTLRYYCELFLLAQLEK